MQLVEIRRRVLAACDWILYIVAIDRVQRKVQNSKILDVLKNKIRWDVSVDGKYLGSQCGFN